MKDFVVPRDTNELARRYQTFVARLLRRYDSVGKHFEDLCQAVWLRLFEADILAKFDTSLDRTPHQMTGMQVSAYLNITFDQWKVAQWRTRTGRHNWAPKPIRGKGCSKDAVYRTAEVEAVRHHFKQHAHIMLPAARQEGTQSRFESYLAKAVFHAYCNFLRSLGRKDKDLYLPPEEDGSDWTANLPGSYCAPDEMVSLYESLCTEDDPDGIILALDDGAVGMPAARTRATDARMERETIIEVHRDKMR